NKQNLQILKSILKENPTLILEVYGHSDLYESSKNDTLLSYKRAQFIKNILTKDGYESCKINVRGYGTKYPMTKDSKSGKNRRVEILFRLGKLINQEIFGVENASILYKGCVETELELKELDKVFNQLSSYLINHDKEKLLITINLPQSFNSLE